jgi:hypothetical protein
MMGSEILVAIMSLPGCDSLLLGGLDTDVVMVVVPSYSGQPDVTNVGSRANRIGGKHPETQGLRDRRTDRRTDGQTDGRTDRQNLSCRTVNPFIAGFKSFF